MRILYVSRQFNRSGYHILQHLLEQRRFEIVGVLVPPVGRAQRRMRWLNSVFLSPLERTRYRAEVRYYRGQNLRFEGSIPRLARRHGIPRIQLPTLRSEESLAALAQLRIDLMVLGGGWPELISPEVLQHPPLGAINTHPSLLPEFRGTDVHRWQVLAGVRRAGTTIHYMDPRFDTGGILGQAEATLSGTETPQQLFEATARVAGPLMVQVLDRIAAAAPDPAASVPQQHRDDPDRYHSKWPWTDADFLAIDWRSPANRIEQLVRASAQESYRYLGPTFSVADRRYILRTATVIANTRSRLAGELSVDGDGMPMVGTGDADASIRLDMVQPYAAVPNRHRARPGRWLTRTLGTGEHPLSLDVPTEEDADGP